MLAQDRMRSSLLVPLVVLAFSLAACGAGKASRTTAPASADASAVPSVPTVPSPRGAAVSPSPSSLHLWLRGPGALVIENRGASPVRLAWVVAIEKKTNAGWSRVPTDLHLFEQCPAPEAPRDGCVEVAPGAALRPAPWTGSFGCTQCEACNKNVAAAAGTYRFVVATCDGETRAASDLSILDREGHIEGPPWAD